MIEISVRQNSKGNWWCSTTHNCYDIYEEGETIEQAKTLISETIKKRNHEGGIHFQEPCYYPKKDVIPHNPIRSIGYASTRIDNNLIG